MYTGIPGGPHPKVLDPHARRFLATPQVTKALARQRQIAIEERQPDAWRRVLAHLGTVPQSTASARQNKEVRSRNYTAHTISAQPRGLELRGGDAAGGTYARPSTLNTRVGPSTAPGVQARTTGGRKYAAVASNPNHSAAVHTATVCTCYGDVEDPCVACVVLERRRKLFAPCTPLEYALSIQRPNSVSSSSVAVAVVDSFRPSRPQSAQTARSRGGGGGVPREPKQLSTAAAARVGGEVGGRRPRRTSYSSSSAISQTSYIDPNGIRHVYLPERPMPKEHHNNQQQQPPRYLQSTTSHQADQQPSSHAEPSSKMMGMGMTPPPPPSRNLPPSGNSSGPSHGHHHHQPPPRPPTPVLRPADTEDYEEQEPREVLDQDTTCGVDYTGGRPPSSSTRVTFNFASVNGKGGRRGGKKKINSREQTKSPAFVAKYTGRQFRAACTIQAWFVGNEERRWLRIQKNAVLTIQRIYRLVLRRRACYYAAYLLQSVGRGTLMRQRFKLFSKRRGFHRDEYATRRLIVEQHDGRRSALVMRLSQQLDVLHEEIDFRKLLVLEEVETREAVIWVDSVAEEEGLHRRFGIEETTEPHERRKIEECFGENIRILDQKVSLDKQSETMYVREHMQWYQHCCWLSETCRFQTIEMGLEPHARRNLVELVELNARVALLGKVIPRWHHVHVLFDATRQRETFLRTLIEEEQYLWYEVLLQPEYARRCLMVRYLEGFDLVRSFEGLERKNVEKRRQGKYVA